MRTPRRPGRRVLRLAVVLGVWATPLALLPTRAGSEGSAPPPFSASVSAVGVLGTLSIPGFPATTTPVDSGGPTAQVAADTLGSSTAYAALPDPGKFVTTVPGLVAGLANTGVGGLPPTQLPTLPNYPLFVASDVSSNPDASIGSGPYGLSTHSGVASGTASASGGLQTGLLGNAALITSTASITSSTSGAVATATSDVQGLSIGPLTLGEVKTTARMALGSGGTPEPTSELSIAGLRIGGVAVEVTPIGLSLGGPNVPLPIDDVLRSLLAAADISIEVVTGHTFEGTVVAPAVVITMPTPPLDQLSLGAGTLSLKLGATSASMSAPDATPADVDPAIGSGGSGSTDGAGAILPADVGTGIGDLPPLEAVPPSSPPALASAPRVGTTPTGPVELIGLFDVRDAYSLLSLGALVALGLSQIIRLLGVRRRWV